MIKKLALGLMSLGLAVGAYAATPGTDNAADPAYNLGWTEGSDGGTPATFNPWSLTENNNNGTTVFAGYFIGDSTAGSGDINTSGKSFGIFANPAGAFEKASCVFDLGFLCSYIFTIGCAWMY